MIQQAKFIGAFPKCDDCPKSEMAEFAFIGRSNVGKSSLINLITRRKELAKVSQTPGKTQNINLFLIDESWYLADLPGYGYAKLSKTTREHFDKMIRYYLKKRENLACVFVLIDSSIPPQKIDLDFINWLGENSIAFVVAFTKTDKANPQEVEKNVKQFKIELSEKWEALPGFFFTSSKKYKGDKEIMAFIKQVITQE